jgi:OH-DDVA meta-cleavage compound hydrolase
VTDPAAIEPPLPGARLRLKDLGGNPRDHRLSRARSAPPQLWAYKAGLLAARGSHGRGAVKVSDDEIMAAMNAAEIHPRGHLEALKHHGTDVQLISPRPFQLMHSEKPAKLVRWFAEECHNVIHRQTQMFPKKFFGVASLPQAAGEPIETALPKLTRCVKELGFVGCLLNPDPYENSGTEAPAMGDRYWYPLYEKLCELDIPAHIHTTSSRSERVTIKTRLTLRQRPPRTSVGVIGRPTAPSCGRTRSRAPPC